MKNLTSAGTFLCQVINRRYFRLLCRFDSSEFLTWPQMHRLDRVNNLATATMIGRTERKREEKLRKMPTSMATACHETTEIRNEGRHS